MEKWAEIIFKKWLWIILFKIGGDFDKPTKEDIFKVLEELKEFAKNFRNPEIIKKHYGEIMQLVEKL